MEPELKKFIKLLENSEEVTITYKSTIPDMDDFFDIEEKDVLFLLCASVEIAIRSSGLDKVKAEL